jgi:uncharacterized protein YndB with AHSA1/START domain
MFPPNYYGLISTPMTVLKNNKITVKATVAAPLKKVWELWTQPFHIVKWNHASDDWHTTKAENNLAEGGVFLSRMEAKDGSMGFDFTGKYLQVVKHQLIAYVMDDGRKVEVSFATDGHTTTVTEQFDAESQNSLELQQNGWQAILNNFKRYAEASPDFETLHFEINIDAPSNKVYQTVISPTHYNQWTSPFNPTSRFEGTWEKGSDIAFRGTDENGVEGGMISQILENQPNRFISILHKAVIPTGSTAMTDVDMQNWAGAMENYSFVADGEKTLMVVDTDTLPSFQSYFNETWPLALQKLKEICEQNQ